MTDTTIGDEPAPSRDEYARALADRIDARVNLRIPEHVAYRLTALLYPQPVIYLDGKAEQDTEARENRRLKGNLVLFTDTAMVAVTFSNVRDAATISQNSTPDHSASVVALHMTARNRLRDVTIAAAGNDSALWQEAFHDKVVFAQDGQVSLHYDGTTKPVTLPIGKTAAADLGPLLEGLSRDLGA